MCCFSAAFYLLTCSGADQINFVFDSWTKQIFHHFLCSPVFLQCSACWLGSTKDIRPVKCWVLICWWWWFDWSLIAPVKLLLPTPSSTVAIRSRMASSLHKFYAAANSISLFMFFIRSCNKIQNGNILVLAYPGCPGKWPLDERRLRVSSLGAREHL